MNSTWKESLRVDPSDTLNPAVCRGQAFFYNILEKLDVNKKILDNPLIIRDLEHKCKSFLSTKGFEYDPNNPNYDDKDVRWRNIDINACRKYRTKDDRRRPIDGESNPISDRTVNRFTNLLANLLGANKYSELLSEEKDVVSGVINQLKNEGKI